MKLLPVYFKIEELVCPHVYSFKETAWQFFDSRLLMTLDLIRNRIGKPITVNNWKQGGEFSQRGFRCIQCELVKDAINENRLYVSPHMTGQAVDFDVLGMEAEEVREWIVSHSGQLPYPIRLESGVNWVHLDSRDADQGKVFIFKP